MAVAVFAPDHSPAATPVPVLSLRVQPPAFVELLNPLSHIAQGGSIVVRRALERWVWAERCPNALGRATGRARASARHLRRVAAPLLPGPLLSVDYQLGIRRHVLGVADDHRHEHDGHRDHRIPKRHCRDLTQTDGGPR
jgi:hypothetical protein